MTEQLTFEVYPPIEIGSTVHTRRLTATFSGASVPARKPYVVGVVVSYSDYHGLRYEVRHMDSQTETGYVFAYYEPSELEVIGRSFVTTVNTAIERIIPTTETGLIDALTKIRDEMEDSNANPWVEAADALMLGAHPDKGAWVATLATYWDRSI